MQKPFKFFTKWLPVEDEVPNVKDTHVFTPLGLGSFELRMWKSDFEIGEYSQVFDHETVGYQKVLHKDIRLAKLFMCKTIEVGDTVSFCSDKDDYENRVYPNTGRVMQVGKYQLEVSIDDLQDIIPIPNNYCLHIVGEVSPKAKWVSGGRWFYPDDISIDCIDRKHPNESPGGYTLEEAQFFYKEVERRPDRYRIEIQIKCPTCQTFH